MEETTQTFLKSFRQFETPPKLRFWGVQLCRKLKGFQSAQFNLGSSELRKLQSCTTVYTSVLGQTIFTELQLIHSDNSSTAH